MAKILHIDAEPMIRIATSEHLSDLGHELLEASDGSEGLALFRLHRPDIVLSGLHMPGSDGFWVVEQMAIESPETPVLVISSTADIGEAMRCMRLGAWDFLAKPVTDMRVVGNTVSVLLGRARERREAEAQRQDSLSRNYKLEKAVSRWSKAHAKIVQRLKFSLHSSIRSLAQTVKERDPYTAGHNERVARIATDIGECLGLGKQALDTLFVAGVLHDIGKVSVPKVILNKQGTLNAEEFEEIKGHVTCGYRILKDIPFRGPVAEIVRQHHERFDGTGYPHGLQGDSIMLQARIIAVADVFEALTSDRPYRVGVSPVNAAGHIASQAGYHFCPQCVAAFASVLREHDDYRREK